MRKPLAFFFALLVGCLFVAQSSMAATAAHEGCCLQECKAMAQCAGASCAACPSAVAAPSNSLVLGAGACGDALTATDEDQPDSAFAQTWNPPD